MTVRQAMDAGLVRIRNSEWQQKAYAELYVDKWSREYGPWAIIKEDGIKQQDPTAAYPEVLIFQLGDADDWEEYTGPDIE